MRLMQKYGKYIMRMTKKCGRYVDLSCATDRDFQICDQMTSKVSLTVFETKQVELSCHVTTHETTILNLHEHTTLNVRTIWTD